MQRAIEKAGVLIEALHWIREFRGKVTIIKLGGGVLEDAGCLVSLLEDIVFMETVGMRPVVVHGGGAPITQAMEQRGLKPRFVQGRRYTNVEVRDIVEEVMAYGLNGRIATEIDGLGGRAASLNFRSTNVLFGHRLEMDGDGEPVDLGFVGIVDRVDRQTIDGLCDEGIVPVIPSMCLGVDGQKLNVNADTAAMAVAQAVAAEKLVFVSDVNGVRRVREDPTTLIQSLTETGARELISSGAIEAGMIPKVEACLETLDRGVRKIHIIDGRLPHSLLLEVYTSKGVGTQIVRDAGP